MAYLHAKLSALGNTQMSAITQKPNPPVVERNAPQPERSAAAAARARSCEARSGKGAGRVARIQRRIGAGARGSRRLQQWIRSGARRTEPPARPLGAECRSSGAPSLVPLRVRVAGRGVERRAGAASP